MGQRVARSRVPGQSGTPQALRPVPGLTVAGAMSRGFAIARGVVSPLYIAFETGGRVARNRVLAVRRTQYEALLDEALLNPEIAKTLSMEYTEGTAKIVNRRLRLHLGNSLSDALVEESESEAEENVLRVAP